MTESFQLLQINVLSARDLASMGKSMHTYVVGWINPARKQTTRIDHNGNNCPEWNDRFVFRVTPRLLSSESSFIEIEIYCQAWLRDTLIGSVRVAIANILPASGPIGSTRRSVALQIRRPSGRPQGILNVTVSVLENHRRSMPLSIVNPQEENKKTTRLKPEHEGNIVLRRVKSERSWTTMDNDSRVSDPTRKGPDPYPGQGPASSLGGGSSICNSDVGPSASVVAEAVAKGLYMPPTMTYKNRVRGGNKTAAHHDDDGSSILQWADENSEEGMMTKIERWKMELNKTSRVVGGRGNNLVGEGLRHEHRHHRRSKTEGGRLFKCFGKAYGFEFTIVCGANQANQRHNKNDKKNNVHRKAPSDSETNSQSYIIL
ncbi:uncharacterized protein LOC130797305 [Amaranthus tricolor]|uniref:uncharacterized protein LOC130797305 n=1 Tax=Amaranthus tricolor TaxID=29722 RepID=UPI00258AB484|nr:uncharacterized protein LOC130797305 [Amaranthus tricolor]